MAVKKTSLEAYLKLPSRDVQNYFRKYIKIFFTTYKDDRRKNILVMFVTTSITLFCLLIWSN